MAEKLSGKIVFTSGKVGDYDIWTLDLAAAALKQITQGDFWNDKPNWSPDGEWIVFTSNRTGATEIFKVRAEGGDAIQLTDAGKVCDAPAFSPDGKQIAYTSNESDNYDVWIMNADGKEKRQVTQHNGSDHHVSWTPDGKGLLWSSDRDGGDADVWSLDLSSGEKKQLTTDLGADITPVPSPDGKLIVFVSNRPLDPDTKDWSRDRDKDIWLMAADGSLQAPLTANRTADYCPCWSPDGKYILYAASNDVTQGHLRLIDVSELAAAYESKDEGAFVNAAQGIRSAALPLDREPLKEAIDAKRHTTFLTQYLPDDWVTPMYGQGYFGNERHPDWVA